MKQGMSKYSLSNELERLAIHEINEDPNKSEDYIKHLKEWIEKQPHLNAKIDKIWLLNLLRGCKFSTEKAKAKLEFYYSMRKHAPEFYANRNPFLPEIQQILSKGIINVIAVGKAQNLFIIRWKNADPKKEVLENIVKTSLMLLDLALYSDQMISIGAIYVVADLKDFNKNYVKQFNPVLCKKISYAILKGYALNIKGIFLINAPTITKFILGLFQPFITKKISSRVKLYNNYDCDEIRKYILPSVIPKEYGGESDSLKTYTENSKNKIESYRDWFLEDEKYGTDESKRIGGTISGSDLFGLEGSFRKLDID